MTDIVERLRGGKFSGHDAALDLMDTAADEIEMLRKVLAQYRDDLMYPPTGEQRERRIKMVKKFLEGK